MRKDLEDCFVMCSPHYFRILRLSPDCGNIHGSTEFFNLINNISLYLLWPCHCILFAHYFEEQDIFLNIPSYIGMSLWAECVCFRPGPPLAALSFSSLLSLSLFPVNVPLLPSQVPAALEGPGWTCDLARLESLHQFSSFLIYFDTSVIHRENWEAPPNLHELN